EFRRVLFRAMQTRRRTAWRRRRWRGSIGGWRGGWWNWSEALPEPHAHHAAWCAIMIDRSLSGVSPAMSPYGDGWPWASITIVGHTNSYRREVIRSAAALGGTGGGI